MSKRNTFSLSELSALRAEYARIDSVNPDRLPEFWAIFEGCEDMALQQLAVANVKFVSKLARNACVRRGLV